tara:strand:- start:5450 stop:6151 length:702 start_codon:yes stop_codon:yes gene_type:complete
MLQVFFGSDRQGVRDGATKYIEENISPETTLTTLEAGSYEPGQIADALGAASLFGGEECFLIDTPSDSSDLAEELTNTLSELAESKNIFIVLEGPLLAPAKKKYEKHAAAVEEFKAEKAERFNTFALADALAKRDKRKLWVLMQEAKLNGIREEEIIGILWWQLKALRLASTTTSAQEAGMKTFPYTKAKQALGMFPGDDLYRLSNSLLQLYHEGHAGLVELDLALEKWILSN